MAGQLAMTDDLLAYVEGISGPADAVLAGLRADSAGLPGGTVMPVMPAEAALLAWLVRLRGARRVLEIGTYTGYGALAMASALPPGGRLVTCDVNPKWVAFARPYWERAGVADRIETVIGDASASLDAMLAEDPSRSFDLIFVDADKANYPAYFERVVDLVVPDGLLVFDNTLLDGRVVDPGADDADTRGIRTVNELLRDDDRVDVCVLPLADGVTLARRQPS
ncbi:uncharacterized protein LOC110428986 [Herrania umbratica]|uniref:Uncharacterized protein LOC110428986 n=1 Tax=Herrania umbratica TaxID=108875 RepID=A0A6J1BN97_9ROSI|nr:uncharacterized protein LOC110428986 [Herrania umbratica]